MVFVMVLRWSLDVFGWIDRCFQMICDDFLGEDAPFHLMVRTNGLPHSR